MEIPLNLAVMGIILYLVHKSFHKVTLTGFITTATVALTANYFMVAHLHISFIFALIITLAIFPILQTLFKMAIGKPKKQVIYVPVPVPQPEPEPIVEEEPEEEELTP